MINTYAKLSAAIYAALLKDNTDIVITSDQIANYISLAEAELSRELKIRDLEKTTTLSVTTTAIVALPADYRGIITLEFTDNLQEPNFKTRRGLKEYSLGMAPGRPMAYTIFGSNLYFAPTDATYAATLDYYGSIPAIDASSVTTNTLLQKHPDVYLYGALRQALITIQDAQKLTAVNQNYNQIIDRIKNDDLNSRFPSGTAMRPKNAIGG